MLKRLLKTIESGQAGNTTELAEMIGASPALVEAMVIELEQRGLLQRVGECGDPCAGCPVESLCGIAPRRCAWMLTAEGRRRAQQ